MTAIWPSSSPGLCLPRVDTAECDLSPGHHPPPHAASWESMRMSANTQTVVMSKQTKLLRGHLHRCGQSPLARVDSWETAAGNRAVQRGIMFLLYPFVTSRWESRVSKAECWHSFPSEAYKTKNGQPEVENRNIRVWLSMGVQMSQQWGKAAVSRNDTLLDGAIPLFQNLPRYDFPGGPVANTPPSQCRGPGSDPWSRN